MSNLGEKVDEDEVEEMMAEADADGSGYIDYKEFVAVLLKPLAVPPRKEIPEEVHRACCLLPRAPCLSHHG